MCVTCLGTTCIQCKANALFGAATGTCECYGSYAYYAAAELCLACDSSCLTCSLPGSAQNCTTCSANKYVNPADVGASVPAGPCQSSCNPDTVPDTNNVCLPYCHKSCLRCRESLNSQRCTACPNGTLLAINSDSIDEGICVGSCPDGMALSDDESACESCDASCATCLYPANATSCVTCAASSPYFTVVSSDTVLARSLGMCSSSCSDSGSNAYVDVVDLKCYADGKCPVNRYNNSAEKKCEACHSSCFGCAKPDDKSSCKGCSNSTYFLRLESSSASSGVYASG